MGFHDYWLILKEMIKKSHTFRAGILVHLIFIIFMIIGYYFRLDKSFGRYVFSLDFSAFYNSADMILHDISNLYKSVMDNYNVEFRYLPISAIFFTPFLLFPYDFAFILDLLLIGLTDLWICILIFKTCRQRMKITEKQESLVLRLLGFFLFAPFQVENIATGQTSNLVGLLLVYLYIHFSIPNSSWKNEIIGGICFALGFLMKPLIIILSPFLIKQHREKKGIDFKNTVLRFIPIIITLGINLIYFYIYPKLWEGFWELNFGGSGIIDTQGNSLTGLLYNLFSWNSMILFILLISLFIGIPFLFYFSKKIDINIYYILALTGTFMAYSVSWYNYLAFWAPLVILFFINYIKEKRILIILWILIVSIYPLNIWLSLSYNVNFILPILYLLFYGFLLYKFLYMKQEDFLFTGI